MWPGTITDAWYCPLSSIAVSSAPYMWEMVRLNIFHVRLGGPSASGFGFAPVRWFTAEEVTRPWFWMMCRSWAIR